MTYRDIFSFSENLAAVRLGAARRSASPTRSATATSSCRAAWSVTGCSANTSARASRSARRSWPALKYRDGCYYFSFFGSRSIKKSQCSFPGGVSCCGPPQATIFSEETPAGRAQEVWIRVAEAGRRAVGLRTSIQGVPGHSRGLEAIAGFEEIKGRLKKFFLPIGGIHTTLRHFCSPIISPYFQPDQQRDLAQMDSMTSKLMQVEESLRQERVRNRMMEDKVIR